MRQGGGVFKSRKIRGAGAVFHIGNKRRGRKFDEALTVFLFAPLPESAHEKREFGDIKLL